MAISDHLPRSPWYMTSFFRPYFFRLLISQTSYMCNIGKFGNRTPTVPTIDITSGTEANLAPHVSVNSEGYNKLELWHFKLH